MSEREDAKTELPTAVAWREVEVEGCGPCPFEDFYGAECTHPDALGKGPIPEGDNAPEWCPLRHVSTLVRLKAGTR